MSMHGVVTRYGKKVHAWKDVKGRIWYVDPQGRYDFIASRNASPEVAATYREVESDSMMVAIADEIALLMFPMNHDQQKNRISTGSIPFSGLQICREWIGQMLWFKRKPKFNLRLFLMEYLTPEEWREYLAIDMGVSLIGGNKPGEDRLDALEKLALARSKNS